MVIDATFMHQNSSESIHRCCCLEGHRMRGVFITNVFRGSAVLSLILTASSGALYFIEHKYFFQGLKNVRNLLFHLYSLF